jgi:hypothetical protein
VYTFFAPYSPSYPLSLTPPPSHWSSPPRPPPGRACSALLFSNFVGGKGEKTKWKKWHFSLFEIRIVTQRVSLRYFHMCVCVCVCVCVYYNPTYIYICMYVCLYECMYYNPTWFIS